MKQPLQNAPLPGEEVPVTLLTGFLGSGKTTLVNHLLSASHGRRLAVIVNEFGELGIDASLINGASGGVIELANGCICCATQGDLCRALEQVLVARPYVEAVLVETSGLADPGPVIQALSMYRFSPPLRLDGVITVIDAANFDRNLENADAAYQQIVLADVLLVNKIDLVSAGTPYLIEDGLRKLNTAAPVIACTKTAVPPEFLLGPHRREGAADAERQIDQHEHHHDGFESVVLKADRPLAPERFDAWLQALPDSVVRAKGFVRFAGTQGTQVVHVVGARRTVEKADQEKAAASAIVVIGRGLPVAELQAALESCAA